MEIRSPSKLSSLMCCCAPLFMVLAPFASPDPLFPRFVWLDFPFDFPRSLALVLEESWPWTEKNHVYVEK